MKLFTRILLLLALTAQLSAATTWKVTTWNLAWFPSGKPDFTDAKIEAERINEAAKLLRELNPDIILLQEVRDEAAMEALAKAIGKGHQVIVVSRFKQGNRIGQQQQAILAKFPAKAAYWKDWTTKQHVNPPRGYAFALFETAERKRVGVYSLHLKSNAMGRDVKDRAKQETLNRLQRELAADQLVEHMTEIEATRDLATRAFIVGGDFNTDSTQERFAQERTLTSLKKAGFSSPMFDVPIEKRTTIPAKGRYPDTTFDWLFFRGVVPRKDFSVTPTKVSDHRPVTFIVEIK